MISKKIIISLSTGLFAVLIIWYLLGMPYGYIPGKYDNKTNSYYIPLSKARLEYPSDGKTFFVAVRFPNYKKGVIDSTGKIIIPIKYDKIRSDSGIYILEHKGLKGISDRNGNIIIPVQYPEIDVDYKIEDSDYPFHNRRRTYIVQDKNMKFGMADRNGKLIIPCIYKSHFTDGGYTVFGKKSNLEEEWYTDVFDNNGNRILLDAKYKSVRPGATCIPFFIASKNDKEQYCIHKKTLKSERINFIATYMYCISDDVIATRAIYSDSLKGKIAWSDTDNSAIVTVDKHRYPTKYGLIDKMGNVVQPFIYDDVGRVSHNMILATIEERTSNPKQGILNAHGNWVLLPEYYQTEVFVYFPLIEVKENMNSRKYYVDFNGNIILSKKINIISIDDSRTQQYIIFEKAGKRYKMRYDKVNKRFVWHRHTILEITSCKKINF